MTTYAYLALGDSYTIGEQVPFAENFPNQAVQLLRRQGFSFYGAEIIGKTGWTTDELSSAIENTITLVSYDVVSLLVGVNNQYRGRSAAEFKVEFEHLLQKAIAFAGNKPYRVFVLSIPDWGVTPFAAGRDGKQVAAEIDAYNYICETSSKEFQTNFINITASQRRIIINLNFLLRMVCILQVRNIQSGQRALQKRSLKSFDMDTINFKEEQGFKVWWAWAGLSALNVLFIYAIIQQVFLGKPFGDKPAPDLVLILLGLVFLLLLFFLTRIKLRTRITDEGIFYKYSPFHFKERQIEWHELQDAYMREYNSLHEYGGWGIRYGSKRTGRALNTSASSRIGLQLQFHDGSLLLIGTARPEELRPIIEQVISSGKINRGI